jgi:citrate synthase
MSANDHQDLEKEVRSLLAEVFEVSIDQVPPDTAFGDLPTWDSLGHMNLLAGLEDRFGLEINPDLIVELISIPAITAHLNRLSVDN